TTADLAPELAKASDGLPEAERLAHLIVTQFTDVFDAAAADTPAMAAAWRDWLLPQRELPVLAGGQVHAWAALLAAGHAASAHVVGAQDMALLPYTSGTTGLPKGCIHPHATLMHNAVS